jgi:hypothetical protein
MVIDGLGRRISIAGNSGALGIWVGAVGVGIVAFGLCLWRLMPGLGYWDTAEFQMVLPVMGTAHPTGYPTYVLIGWLASILLAPLGEAALRMNVLSAVFVGVGVAFSADLARRVSGSLVLGVVAGLGVGLTPIVWDIGTHADPHALHFTFVAIILWLLVRWEQSRLGSPMDPSVLPAADPRRSDRVLIAAAVAVGLSVGNHSLTLLLGPPILLYVLLVEPGVLRRPRFVATCVAAFAIPTILVRFELILRAGWLRAPFVYADPSTWSGFWYVTLGEQFHSWLLDPFADGPKRLADLANLANDQFGPFAVAIPLAFVVVLVRQPRYGILTSTALVITCFFNSVFPDGVIDRYYIGPALIVWTWLAILAATAVDVLLGVAPAVGGGLTGARPRLDARPGSAGRVRLIGLTAVALLLIAPSFSAFPDRARGVDKTGDRAAEAWTDEVLSALEPNAVVVSWWSYSTPLWYATIVDHRRTDIKIIDDRNRLDDNLGDLDNVIALYLPTRPVYLIRNGRSELGQLVGRYTVVPIGASIATNVMRVLPIESGAAPVASGESVVAAAAARWTVAPSGEPVAASGAAAELADGSPGSTR